MQPYLCFSPIGQLNVSVIILPRLNFLVTSLQHLVFGFRILLLELIIGQKDLDFGRAANQKGIMLDWVKKLHLEVKLNIMVAKALQNEYDMVEFHEMVQVAFLYTHFSTGYHSKMSEVLRMLEREGLVERWETSQSVETPRFQGSESRSTILFRLYRRNFTCSRSNGAFLSKMTCYLLELRYLITASPNKKTYLMY